MRTTTLVLVLISCGIQLAAQTTTPTPAPAILIPSQTSAMIGVAVNQTARLNVLNSSQPLNSPVAVIACPVTLQIFDDQNNKLAEMAFDNVAPLTAQHLDFVRPTTASATAPLRLEVRGVVNPPGAAVPTGVVILPGPSSICSFSATLEVFDSDTGKTQVVLPLSATYAFLQPLVAQTTP